MADWVRGRLNRSPSLQRADLVLARWQVDRWIRRYPGIQAGPSIRAESFTPRAPYGAEWQCCPPLQSGEEDCDT